MSKRTLKTKVSFSEEGDTIFEVPGTCPSDVPNLFYSTDEIAKMKGEALLEISGVVNSVSSSGKDLIQVGGEFDGVPRKQFRRKSLELVSKADLSPMRGSSNGKADNSKTEKRQPRDRPPRERGAPQRSRSSAGPSRTDGRRAGPGGGRAPPRRTKSSMAAPSGMPAAVSLKDMQAQLAAMSSTGIAGKR